MSDRTVRPGDTGVDGEELVQGQGVVAEGRRRTVDDHPATQRGHPTSQVIEELRKIWITGVDSGEVDEQLSRTDVHEGGEQRGDLSTFVGLDGSLDGHMSFVDITQRDNRAESSHAASSERVAPKGSDDRSGYPSRYSSQCTGAIGRCTIRQALPG